MHRSSLRSHALVALLLSFPAFADQRDRGRDGGCRLEARDDQRDDGDPVLVSFATVGDSREERGAGYLTPQDAIWLQNTKVWSRMIREINARGPGILFFNGDMIMGYQDAAVAANRGELNRQYAFWRGMVTQLLECGTYVAPVPGNHEVQKKSPKKEALMANEQLWRDNMGDLILDVPRFTALVGEAPEHFSLDNNPSSPATAAQDKIGSDQRQLSYSFDLGPAHFAVINTDPFGYDSHAPAAWLAADFRAARDNGAQHFFVFGHKPAYSYFYPLADGTLSTKPSGLDAVSDLAGRDVFWSTIEQYGASYFCGHEHIYDVRQPRAASGGHAWQVIVGSGGSPFEDGTVRPLDRTYAYAVVEVHRSGRVRAAAYGFSEDLGPTRLLKEWDLR